MSSENYRIEKQEGVYLITQN